MKSSIGDDAAIAFAGSFYRAIGFGQSIRNAFDQGIAALLLEGIPEEDIPELVTQTGVDCEKLVLLKPGHAGIEDLDVNEQPFKVSGIENEDVHMMKEHYRAKGSELMLPRFHDKDSLLARGYSLAFYPGTKREVWIMNSLGKPDHIAMLRPIE